MAIGRNKQWVWYPWAGSSAIMARPTPPRNSGRGVRSEVAERTCKQSQAGGRGQREITKLIIRNSILLYVTEKLVKSCKASRMTMVRQWRQKCERHSKSESLILIRRASFPWVTTWVPPRSSWIVAPFSGWKRQRTTWKRVSDFTWTARIGPHFPPTPLPLPHRWPLTPRGTHQMQGVSGRGRLHVDTFKAFLHKQEKQGVVSECRGMSTDYRRPSESTRPRDTAKIRSSAARLPRVWLRG